MPYSSNFLSSMVKITELFGTSISISLVADKADVWIGYMYEDSPGDFFWSDRSRSLVFPVDGVRSLSLRKDWEITSVRLKHKSSSWESFCFDVFVVGGLTSVLMADDRLLINVLIGTRVVPFGVLRRVGSWWQLQK